MRNPAALVPACCLVGFILALGGACGPPATEEPGVAGSAPEQTEGHRRMVEELARIAEESDRDNPFLGEWKTPGYRADHAALGPDESIARRWLLTFSLGEQEARLGNEERAIQHYLEAHTLLRESPDPVPREHYLRTVLGTGVAFLRRAETLNCVRRRTRESCLLPLEGKGVFADKRAAREAVHFLTEAIEITERGSREFLRVAWLLNIGYMAIGIYPDGVPAQHRLPPEIFASDEAFPRFSEVATDLGLDSFDVAGGSSAADFDGDGDIDLMVTTSDTRGQLRYHRNNGDGTFSEHTREAGLEGLLGGLNINHADYDNDGAVDALILRGGRWRQSGQHPNSLLRNNADGTFTDVTFDAGLGDARYPSPAAAWADYDLDGDLDLYVGTERDKGMSREEGSFDTTGWGCLLYRNNGDGTFTDVAVRAGVVNMRYTNSVIWGDYDGDRYPDLYVSNNGDRNRLYHNDGDGTFTDVATGAGVEYPVASSVAWFWDVNNDGNLDLYVAARGGPRLPEDVASVLAGLMGLSDPAGEESRLYLGDGRGGFRDVARAWNVARPTLPIAGNFGDLDNDGFVDFYLGTGYPSYEALIPNVMYRNRRGAGFADVTTAGGFGHLQKGNGVSFADFDNDGDQDVFELGGPWRGDGHGNALWDNPGFGNHWIKVSLVGTRSNRLGIGSRIRLDVVEDGEPLAIYKWADSGGSFGANPLRYEIGVGSAERIESVEVYWPASDETQRFTDVAVDRWIEVTEGEGQYRTHGDFGLE